MTVREYAVWYDEHNFTPLTSIGINLSTTFGMKKTLGVCFSKVYDLVYDKSHLLFLIPKTEMDEIVGKLVQKIVSKPEWADTFNDKMMDAAKVLEKTTKENARLAKKADAETLASFHDTFERQTAEKFNFGNLSILAESNEGALSREYYEQVKEKVGEGNFAAVAELLTPCEPTAQLLERMELLELARESKKGGTGKKKAGDAGNNLDHHFKKWEWLPYAFTGPSWKKDACQKEFDKTMKKPAGEIKKELGELKGRAEAIEKRRAELMDSFQFDARQRALTKAIVGFARTKYQRKERYIHAHYYYHPILSEIARRLCISIPEARLLTPEETRSALVEGKKFDLAGRTKLVAYEYSDGKVKVLEGEKAVEIERLVPKEDIRGITLLSGQCACPGVGKGAAKIINTHNDMHKMREGDVLVSYATYPELVEAMKKASAIVTDRGGVTCHAAIVSRELGKPCVIGTKTATKWLKDGQIVEVDATRGIVRKL